MGDEESVAGSDPAHSWSDAAAAAELSPAR